MADDLKCKFVLETEQWRGILRRVLGKECVYICVTESLCSTAEIGTNYKSAIKF